MRLQMLFSDPAGFFTDLLLILPALLIAISFHEFAHAFAANAMGDPSPRAMGRLTLDPFAHMDPIGLLMLTFLGFGYGKPVQVNPANFKNRFWGEIFVALAGVTMNLFLSVVFTIVYLLMVRFGVTSVILLTIISNIVQVNVVLMLFNLLPIPPLDGYRVVKRLFIGNVNPQFFWRLEQFGFVIVLILLATGIFTPFLSRAVGSVITFLLNTFSFIIR